MLGRELQRRRGPKSKPFVVLHTPMPQSISNALEQLFARNQFAQALVNSGAVSGVLATGINTADDLDRQDMLLESLRTADNELDIMRTQRASAAAEPFLSTEETVDLPASWRLGVASTALFLNVDPEPL
jgi:hypothetical protein